MPKRGSVYKRRTSKPKHVSKSKGIAKRKSSTKKIKKSTKGVGIFMTDPRTFNPKEMSPTDVIHVSAKFLSCLKKTPFKHIGKDDKIGKYVYRFGDVVKTSTYEKIKSINNEHKLIAIIEIDKINAEKWPTEEEWSKIKYNEYSQKSINEFRKKYPAILWFALVGDDSSVYIKKTKTGQIKSILIDNGLKVGTNLVEPSIKIPEQPKDITIETLPGTENVPTIIIPFNNQPSENEIMEVIAQ
jgi:hypothetical protein